MQRGDKSNESIFEFCAQSAKFTFSQQNQALADFTTFLKAQLRKGGFGNR